MKKYVVYLLVCVSAAFADQNINMGANGTVIVNEAAGSAGSTVVTKSEAAAPVNLGDNSTVIINEAAKSAAAPVVNPQAGCRGKNDSWKNRYFDRRSLRDQKILQPVVLSPELLDVYKRELKNTRRNRSLGGIYTFAGLGGLITSSAFYALSVQPQLEAEDYSRKTWVGAKQITWASIGLASLTLGTIGAVKWSIAEVRYSKIMRKLDPKQLTLTAGLNQIALAYSF